jgi:hypothetical protein
VISIFVRLILIPLAYGLAVVAAASVIAIIALIRAYPPVAGDPIALAATIWVIFGDFIRLGMFAGAAALVPSLIAIVAAEVFAIRNVLYFCGAALVAAFFAAQTADAAVLPSLPAEASVPGAAALVAGALYWLLCGRLSGMRLEREPRTS